MIDACHCLGRVPWGIVLFIALCMHRVANFSSCAGMLPSRHCIPLR